MAMCANNPGKARGKCPSKALAREFMHKKRKKRSRYEKPDKHGFY